MITCQRSLGKAVLTILVTTAVVVSGASPVGAAAADPPTVTSLLPTLGAVGGGTRVTVKGTGFSDVHRVVFGTTAGTNVTVKSSTKLKVTSPAHSGGNVDVRVVTGSGTSAVGPGDGFKYVPPPVITSVSPDRGDRSGGVYVLVDGRHLVDIQSVTVGGHRAMWKKQQVDNLPTPVLLVPVPPGKVGTTQIVVGTLYGTSRRTKHSEYHYATSTWTHTNTTPPGSGAGTSEFNAADCSASTCYAVGDSGSKISANDRTPLVDAQSAGGKWHKATVQPPQGFESFSDAVLRTVSCGRANTCAALGTDHTAGRPKPLLAVGSGRKWAAYYPPMPSDWTRDTDWAIDDIACRMQACAAIGWYLSSYNTMRLLVLSYVSGTWTLRDPSDQAEIDPDMFEDRNEYSAVTCPSASECLAVDGLGTHNPVAVHIPIYGSGPATIEELPFDADPNADTAVMYGIACASTTFCVAIGEQYHAGFEDEEEASNFSWFYEAYDNGTWTSHDVPLVGGVAPNAGAAVQTDDVDCATTGTCYVTGRMGPADPEDPPPTSWPLSATTTRVNASGASTVVPAVPDRYLGSSSVGTVDCAFGPTCQIFGSSTDAVYVGGRSVSHKVIALHTFTTRLGAPQRPMYVTYPKFPHGQLLQTAMACRAADDCIIAGTVHVADGSDHGQGHNRVYVLHN